MTDDPQISAATWARQLITKPPTDARRECHYIAARFTASGDAPDRIRRKFRGRPVALITRPAHVDLIAILTRPIPVERAYSIVTAIARMIPYPCTALAPQIGRRGVWELPDRLSERDLYRIALARAGEIDLRAMVRDVPGSVEPVAGPVATSAGPSVFVEVQ